MNERPSIASLKIHGNEQTTEFILAHRHNRSQTGISTYARQTVHKEKKLSVKRYDGRLRRISNP